MRSFTREKSSANREKSSANREKSSVNHEKKSFNSEKSSFNSQKKSFTRYYAVRWETGGQERQVQRDFQRDYSMTKIPGFPVWGNTGFFICRRAYARKVLKMKKQWVFILGVLLMCGLAFIGCDNGTTDDEIKIPVPKSLTITGIDPDDLSESGIVVGVKPTSTNQNDALVYGYGADLSYGTVTIQLKNKSASNGYDEDEDDWTGSGGYYLFAWESSNGDFSGEPDWYTASKENFQTAKTTINWTSFLTYAEPKSVTIENINSSDLGGTNMAGVAVFAEMPQGDLQATAVRYGTISGTSLSVALSVPNPSYNDTTHEDPSNPWRWGVLCCNNAG
jgi:hypothetical protein